MRSIEFAVPDALVLVDSDSNDQELRDRLRAATTASGYDWGFRSICWSRPGVDAAFDLAAWVAWWTVENGILIDDMAPHLWTIAGRVRFDGTVTGGVISDGIDTAYRVTDLTHAHRLLLDELGLIPDWMES